MPASINLSQPASILVVEVEGDIGVIRQGLGQGDGYGVVAAAVVGNGWGATLSHTPLRTQRTKLLLVLTTGELLPLLNSTFHAFSGLLV